VSTRTERPAGSRLRQIARAAAEPPQPPVAAEERCELCGEPIPPEHRHLIDVESRQLLCACRACQILFDRRAAGGSHYRLLPERRRRVEDFELDDAAWAELRIPVEMAFFFHSTAAERVAAFYPSPMGATESLLELDAWRQLERANPVLDSLEPDVEALLVNRARGAHDCFVVPVDDCYRLVGLIRTRWRGLTGGQEVWQEIERFFAELAERAEPVSRTGQEVTWQTSGSASQT
jgi:Family of unknown function (DUF5947)